MGGGGLRHHHVTQKRRVGRWLAPFCSMYLSLYLWGRSAELFLVQYSSFSLFGLHLGTGGRGGQGDWHPMLLCAIRRLRFDSSVCCYIIIFWKESDRQTGRQTRVRQVGKEAK